MAMFDNISPVFVMTIFRKAVGMGLSDSGSDEMQVLDINLYNQAKEAGKKTIGIETTEGTIKSV